MGRIIFINSGRVIGLLRSTCECHAVIDLIEKAIGFGGETDAEGGECASDAYGKAALQGELDENGVLGVIPVGEDACEIWTKAGRGIMHGLDCARGRRSRVAVKGAHLGCCSSELQNLGIDVVDSLQDLGTGPGVSPSEVCICGAGSRTLFVDN